jgi:hypothetical protein
MSTSITVLENVTSVSINEPTTQITIDEVVTNVSLSAAPSILTSAGLTFTPHGTVTAINVQEALEQVASQSFRSNIAPSGSNLQEGDLWYNPDDDQLKVYRDSSTNNFEFVPLAAATDTMDNLDGGQF